MFIKILLKQHTDEVTKTYTLTLKRSNANLKQRANG